MNLTPNFGSNEAKSSPTLVLRGKGLLRTLAHSPVTLPLPVILGLFGLGPSLVRDWEETLAAERL